MVHPAGCCTSLPVCCGLVDTVAVTAGDEQISVNEGAKSRFGRDLAGVGACIWGEKATPNIRGRAENELSCAKQTLTNAVRKRRRYQATLNLQFSVKFSLHELSSERQRLTS